MLTKNEASCVLPEDIVFRCILTRVPVKSVVRFKSVCKPWLELLSGPEFVKLHHAQFSSDPKNESVVLYRFGTSTMTIYSFEKKQAVIVDHPVGPQNNDLVCLLGCCNGLICFGRLGRGFVLLNPATKLSKFVPLSDLGFGDLVVLESLGFGYDAEGDDFKLVRIIFCSDPAVVVVYLVEVYSVRSDSWTRISLDFPLQVFEFSCDLIVNGNPYWMAITSDDWGAFSELVCFDVTKQVFKTVPLPSFCQEVVYTWVGLNGSLGALVWNKNNIDGIETDISSLDAWAFDESDQTWRKTHSLGPVNEECRFLQCLKNGNVVGKRLDEDGKLFVYDPRENGRVDDIVIDDGGFDEVYGYTESLVQIEGMKQGNEWWNDLKSRN